MKNLVSTVALGLLIGICTASYASAENPVDNGLNGQVNVGIGGAGPAREVTDFGLSDTITTTYSSGAALRSIEGDQVWTNYDSGNIGDGPTGASYEFGTMRDNN